MKIVISAGGTGGHIYPALAIVNKFKELDKDTKVLYIGTHNRMEKEIVPSKGIPYEELKIYGLSKTDIKRDIKNIKYIIDSYKKSIKLIKDFNPDAVIGVGGYVTLPVILAAHHEKKKIFLHEQNSIPGKTNKFLAKYATKIFTSFENSNKYFKDSEKVVFTGNPCSDNVKLLKLTNKTSLGFSKDKKLIIITTGSLGSTSINPTLAKFVKLMGNNKDIEVLFITGKISYQSIIDNNEFASNIKVVEYFDNLASLYHDADLVIGRAGAGTISELVAARIPSLLIPSPNVANNHQYYNALDLSKTGGSIMIEEKDINETILYEKVMDLFNNNKLNDMKKNLEKIESNSVSEKIYEEIKESING